MTEELKEASPRRRIALLGGTATAGDCMAALLSFFDTRAMISGSSIEEYENVFARTIGVRYGFSFCSGRVGFYALLRCLGIGPGDEVLLQVPTHIVVANAIRYAGGRPVFADCTPENYTIDVRDAERKITPRTKVLLIQHTFGIPADMDEVQAFARRYGLIVIEDCVHALGARYDGRMVGSLGKAAFFSTEETKTISTTMGGMVVTDDEELAVKLRAFQAGCPWPSRWLTAQYVLKFILYYLLTEPSVHRYMRTMYELIGKRHPLPRPTNSDELRGLRPKPYEQRLSNIQAALALRQLRRLEENLSHRRAIANVYSEQLFQRGFRLPKPPEKAEPAFVRYPVWVEDRAKAVNGTAPHVVMGTWFTSVLEEAASPAYGDYAGACPQAEDAAAHLINLPTHPRVKAGDAIKIVSALSSATRASRDCKLEIVK